MVLYFVAIHVINVEAMHLCDSLSVCTGIYVLQPQRIPHQQTLHAPTIYGVMYHAA